MPEAMVSRGAMVRRFGGPFFCCQFFSRAIYCDNLLTHRELLQSKAIAIENDLRGTLRNFGLKVGIVGKVRFEARIKELVENLRDLAVLVEPLLLVRRVLREQIIILHRHLLGIVRDDDVCGRLMTTAGVGRVVALLIALPSTCLLASGNPRQSGQCLG